MSLDCAKSHSHCKARCCKMLPFNEIVYRDNEDKRTKPVMREEIMREGYILPITQDLSCCFLNEDLSCNIYDIRPEVCKKYGDESDLMLTCEFQDKDGNIRNRGRRRYLEKKKQKYSDGALERLKQKTYKAMKSESFLSKLKLKENGNK